GVFEGSTGLFDLGAAIFSSRWLVEDRRPGSRMSSAVRAGLRLGSGVVLGEEVGDEVLPFLGAFDHGQVAGGDLGELGAGDVLGELAVQDGRYEVVGGGVDDQGGDADAGEVFADVHPAGEVGMLDGAVGDVGCGVAADL